MLCEFKLGNKATETTRRICSVLRVFCEYKNHSKVLQLTFEQRQEPHSQTPYWSSTNLYKVQLEKEIKHPHETSQELAFKLGISNETT